MDPAFAPNGKLIALRAADGRISAVDVETARVLLAVEDRPSRSVRRAGLLFGSVAGYMAVSLPEGVVLHAFSSGEVAAIVPALDNVWRMALSGDGRVVAVATQHRVALWSLRSGP
jgi:hypothetical protein